MLTFDCGKLMHILEEMFSQLDDSNGREQVGRELSEKSVREMDEEGEDKARILLNSMRDTIRALRHIHWN